MIRVFFVIIVIILKTFALDLTQGKTCITPYQENGTCVPIFSCAVITSALSTLTPRALRFAQDSQCGCDMGMVCCGSFNNQSYSPLINCSTSPQQEIVTIASASVKVNPNTLAKDTTADLPQRKSCVTPYGENATCVPLEKCSVISSALFKHGDRGHRLFKDSQCCCDGELVCCGTFNNKSYTPLIDCAPPPQPEKILLSDVSDESICGLHSSTDRIKGGTVVKFDELPWIAALECQSKLTKENAGFRCGGSIITERYILTAAHCIVNAEFTITKVWLGVTNTSSEKYCPNIYGKAQCINNVQVMNVEKAIPHEFYDSIDKFNDIGLLLLEDDIEFSNYVRPICLPSRVSELPRFGTYLTVAGWGATEYGKPYGIKLKVEIPLQDNNICNLYLRKIHKVITPKQLCVGGEMGKDSCEGDSGGPLMYELVGVNHDIQWFQQGIVSYGSGCGIEGRPGVYARVSSYEKWIFNKIYDLNKYLGNGDPCTTINNTIGTCVPLTTCGEVSKAISTRSSSTYDTIFNFKCGYDVAEGGLVCCDNPAAIIRPNWNSTALPDKTTCGILKNEPRIDGTKIKDLAEFPWVAGIEGFSKNLNTTGIRCIGTIINSRYVLASADCLINDKPVNVWLGHWNTSAYNDCKKVNNTVDCTNPVQKIKIEATILFPFTYLYHNSYDIALVFLENEIKFSDYISPICLPSPNLPKLTPGACMTVLIGTDEVTKEFIITSDMMLKKKISLVSNDQCNKILTRTSGSVLNSLHMCAGCESKRHCNRLRGAPLMRTFKDKPTGRKQWYLEGLAAFVPYECTGVLLEEYPGSYARVDRYLDWIINIISEDF